MADNKGALNSSFDIHELAILYLKNQDLSNLSPEELYDKYEDACHKIKIRKKETASGWLA